MKADWYWQVACGGDEPIMLIEGKHYQLYWNSYTGERAYYCQEDDLFLTRGMEYLLPKCLTH
jgi:hypothetical protein